jgi:hypothetical protein
MMEGNDAIKQLNEIKETIRATDKNAMRGSGWYFIVWGIIWIFNFSISQFVPEIPLHIARFITVALNVLGIIITYLLSIYLYGKDGKLYIPKFNLKIGLGIFSSILFFLSLIVLLELNQPRQITLLLVLSGALCYMLVGLLKNIPIFFLGLLVLINAFIAGMFIVTYFYLYIGIICGGILILTGIFLLGRNK